MSHLRDVHNLSPNQYKNKYPQSKYPDARMASPIVLELLRRFDRTTESTQELEVFVPSYVPTGHLDQDFQELRKVLPPVAQAKMPQDAWTPKVDPFFHFPVPETKAVMAALLLGKNVYISGPTGCGKTELLFQVLAQLRRPTIRANMNGDVTSANFLGQVRASQAKGGTWLKYGMLPNAMMAGIPLIIDEMDYTPPHIGATMNSALERSRVVHLPDADETITAEKGFLVLATANTGGKGDSSGVYTGTEVQNTALLDRFAVKISMDYMPVGEELKMLQRRFPKAEKQNLEKLLRAATEVRVSFKQGNIAQTFSTRKMIDILELEPVTGRKVAMELTLLNWLDEEDKATVKGLMQRVDPTVMG